MRIKDLWHKSRRRSGCYLRLLNVFFVGNTGNNGYFPPRVEVVETRDN